MIRIARIFAAVFAAGFARAILPKPQPPVQQPLLPCGECEPGDFLCACLAAQFDGIDGYNVSQLRRDIEELENQ